MADAFESQLRLRGAGVMRWNSRPQEAPTALLRKATAVAVVGGDGTVRDAAEALLRAAGAGPGADDGGDRAGPLAPLLVVPAGTANLLAEELGISGDPDIEALAAALDTGRRVMVDVACAGDRPCLMMASVGIDALVVHMLSSARRGPIRRFDYVGVLARAMLAYDFPPLRIIADRRCIFSDAPAVMLAGNIAGYGAGFPIAPLARCDDGLLDVCVMPCSSPAELARLTALVAAGGHVGSEGVVYARAQQVRVESPRPVPVQTDGDPAGFTPLDLRLPGRRVAFIVPSGARPRRPSGLPLTP